MRGFYKYAFFVLFLISCKGKHKEGISISSGKDIALPYFNSPDFTPEWNVKKHQIPEFSFLNQNGEEVTNETYKGKIYVADFFFTVCPGICPKLEKSMSKLQEYYQKEDRLKLLSHTVMPWNDSIPVLKAYGEKNDIDASKWNLVTGDKDALYTIARKGYFADEKYTKTQDEDAFLHTENFILVDGNGYIRGVYNGTVPIDIERLKRHIAILLREYD